MRFLFTFMITAHFVSETICDMKFLLLIVALVAAQTESGKFNSDAVGMAFARPLGFEIDFVRNPVSGSAAGFFVIILKFVFTPIFEIKVLKKNSLTPKKFHFRKPIFNKHTSKMTINS